MVFTGDGNGFTWKSEDMEKNKAVALDAWGFAKQTMLSKKYQKVIKHPLYAGVSAQKGIAFYVLPVG